MIEELEEREKEKEKEMEVEKEGEGEGEKKQEVAPKILVQLDSQHIPRFVPEELRNKISKAN
jgi:hypothetical protein